MTAATTVPPSALRPPCLRCKFPLRTKRAPKIPGTKRASGRGLCNDCYSWEQTCGRLEDYPRLCNRSEDALEDAMILARRGLSRWQVAEQLGYKSPDGLYQVFRRAGEMDLYNKFKLITEGVAA